jgi:DNA polymerase-3 subunit gamma/tau
LSVSPELPLEIAVVQAIASLSAAPETSGDTDGRNGLKQHATPEASRTGRQEPAPDGPGHGPSKTATAIHEDIDTTFARTLTATKVPPTSQLGVEATPSSESTADSGLVSGNSPDPTKDFAVSGNASDPAGVVVTLPDAWPQVIEVARARSRSLQALLRDARPTEMTETELTLAFRHSFHRDALERPENRANIEGAIADVTGIKLKVRCVLAEDTTDAAPLDDTEHFVNEAERVLRGVHARKFRSSKSDS